MTDLIYKICDRTSWEEACQIGVFAGAAVDLQDGYIHFSTASQVKLTAALHFGGRDELMLIAVDPASLGNTLKFEPSRGGDLFPHLYGKLPLSAVVWSSSLLLGQDGRHIFPDMKTGV